MTALERDHLDRAGHVLVGDLDDRRGEIDRRHPGLRGQQLSASFGQRRIEPHPAAKKIAGVEPAQQEIGVGDGR